MIRNDSKALKIVLLIIAVLMLFGGIGTFTMCSIRPWRLMTVNESISPVSEIGIEAKGSGSITIESGNEFRVEGKVKGFKVDGDSLDIELGSAPVTVTVKEGHPLRDIEASTISGALRMTGIKADEISASAVSGKIELRDVYADDLEAEAVSGGITWHGEALKADFKTVSGSMDLESGMTPRIGLDSISGSIDLDSACSDSVVDFSSISGRVEKNDGNLADGSVVRINADTTSSSLHVRTR